MRQGEEETGEIAELHRQWERRFDSFSLYATLSLSMDIELEIIRALEAINAFKESPNYELHRLTTQTPAFFRRGASRAWQRIWRCWKTRRKNWRGDRGTHGRGGGD